MTMDVDHDRARPETVEAVLEVMRTTRSMRRLRPEPVPPEVLREVVRAATWAPTARNRQGCEFVVVTDREQLARLGPLWRLAVEVYDSTAGSPLDADVGPRAAEAIRALAAGLENVPAVIAICHPVSPVPDASQPGAFRRAVTAMGLRRTLRFLRASRSHALLREGASAFPAMENLLLAARTLGLGASAFMLHQIVEQDVASVLGVPEGFRVMALVPVGWPVGHFGPVRRRPVDEVIHHDVW